MANPAKSRALDKKMHPVHELAEQWKKTGRIAFHHPKRKTYSLNGGKEMNYNETHKHLKEFFNK